MSETCGCGASFSDTEDIELIREWRREHRCTTPWVKAGPTGASASVSMDSQPDFVPFGFTAQAVRS